MVIPESCPACGSTWYKKNSQILLVSSEVPKIAPRGPGRPDQGTQRRPAGVARNHSGGARQALTSVVQQLSLKGVDHAIGQLARLLGAAMAAAI